MDALIIEDIVWEYLPCPGFKGAKQFGFHGRKGDQVTSSKELDIWLVFDMMLEFKDAQNDKKSGKILQDEFSTITKYNIADNEELSKAIADVKPSHFINLILFGAKNYDERLNTLLSRSNKLESINIEKCKTLKFLFEHREVIIDEDGYNKYFSQLKELKLT
ncbi:hypothetical protein JHK87_049622 [Glycine soja]|nr:hypothetical protein JHK87_049622 [Glycine soja]